MFSIKILLHANDHRLVDNQIKFEISFHYVHILLVLYFVCKFTNLRLCMLVYVQITLKMCYNIIFKPNQL